jgi:hypothetical protein
MIIMDETMFPWARDNPIKYWDIYESIVNNFKKYCNLKYPDQQVLFLDNTYRGLDQVIEIIKTHNCDINFVFSFIDPPFTWLYLKDQLLLKFPNKKFMFAGEDHAPDFNINFSFVLWYKALQKYSDHEVLPDNMDYTFLSYNYKPHVHRVKLIKQMTEQNVIQLGHCTHPRKSSIGSHVLSSDLGDLDTWRRHFLNISSPVVFRQWQEPLYICEKIHKPIIGLRPFIINGSPRYYHELKVLGFDCFEDIFPVHNMMTELDSLEATMNKNHQIICDVIKDLQSKNLMELYQQLLPRLIANRDHWLKIGRDLTQKFCVDPIELP